jgi:hypothetical protein
MVPKMLPPAVYDELCKYNARFCDFQGEMYSMWMPRNTAKAQGLIHRCAMLSLSKKNL